VTGATNEQTAQRWVQGLTGDWSILAELSSPTMRVWHSHDNQWLTRAESEVRMAEAGPTQAPSSFENLRATVTEDGFVIQGSVVGIGGSAGVTHIVQICTVEDGRIASCEEYIAPEMSLG
jgi:ketosteroid isomerase-like protein